MKKKELSGSTKLVAVLGWPLTYTLSPRFQNAGLLAAGVDAVYLPLATEGRAAFKAALRGLMQSPHFVGANVTNPFKLAAAQLASSLDPAARAIGAANTLVRSSRGWRGHNTDAPGFLAAVAQATRQRPRAKRVLVLGAGGSARAIVWACAQAGASVTVAARRRTQARDLAKRVKGAQGIGLQDPAFHQQIALADWVVNTVPGPDFARRAGRSLPRAKGGVACDISYVPVQTPFLSSASRKGWRTVGGLGMLLEQGTLSFELWFGRRAPRKAMQRALSRGH